MKNTCGHTGINSCDRCVVKAVSLGRRSVFRSGFGEPRNRHKFDEMGYSAAHDDEDEHTPHQKGPSPLMQRVDCIYQLPIDAMHNVFEGT